MEPHLVEKIESPGGMVVDAVKDKKIKRVMTEEEANILTGYMKKVTQEDGTASVFSDLPFEVAGKTGSAENPHGADHGLFVGFAPADAPEVVICVIYENSGGSHYITKDTKSFFVKALEK